MARKQLQGTVVSNKMSKTLVVSVASLKEHKKYKRRFKSHKKYKAQGDEKEYNIGDIVLIEECRPISKDKRWQVIKKVQANVADEPAGPDDLQEESSD